MLGRSASPPMAFCPQNDVDDRWKRNEIEDVKRAIEHFYEFKEKLHKLHPMALETIEVMLQRNRY